MRKSIIAGCVVMLSVGSSSIASAMDGALVPPLLPPATADQHSSGPAKPEKTLVRHRQSKTFRTARALRAGPQAGRYQEQIARHAAEHGIPVGLADAVVRIESRYNASVVHAGSYGLMQIRPQTARGVGFSGSPSALLDPDTNLRFGMKYLAMAYHDAHGDTCRTLMRYQSGIAATRMSGANRAYCAKALGIIASR